MSISSFANHLPLKESSSGSWLLLLHHLLRLSLPRPTAHAQPHWPFSSSWPQVSSCLRDFALSVLSPRALPPCSPSTSSQPKSQLYRYSTHNCSTLHIYCLSIMLFYMIWNGRIYYFDYYQFPNRVSQTTEASSTVYPATTQCLIRGHLMHYFGDSLKNRCLHSVTTLWRKKWLPWECWLGRGTEEHSGVLKIFSILIRVMVIQTHVDLKKTYPDVYIPIIYLFVYLN